MDLVFRIYKNLPIPIQTVAQTIGFVSLQIFSKCSRFFDYYQYSKLKVKFEVRKQDSPFCDVRLCNGENLKRPFEHVHTIEIFDKNRSILTVDEDVFDNLKNLGVEKNESFIVLSEVINFCNVQNCSEILFHIYPWESYDGSGCFSLKLNEPMFL